MFDKIHRKIRFYSVKNSIKEKNDEDSLMYSLPVSSNLKKNIEIIREAMCNSDDIVIREFALNNEKKENAAIIFIEGMINKEQVSKNIISPLVNEEKSFIKEKNINGMEIVKRKLVTASEIKEAETIGKVLDNILSGCVALLHEGSNTSLVIAEKKIQSRAVEEPPTESVIRGPRQGFTENLKVNMLLLRRIIKDNNLCMEKHTIGFKTKTEVCVAFIKNIAKPELVEEIRKRLGKIKTDAILESGYIEEFIEDAPFSIFSTISNSEKPDKIASKMLEGRVAIIIDGTPVVLALPMLFISSFQSSEDYYSRSLYASVIRLLRFIAYAISVLAPATYVALTVYHQELIPTPLLITITAKHKSIPFPGVLEALIMLVVFDILREAGVRLPKAVGSAVSIVGALVLGEASVSAGLISPIMVIVIAATAISSFVVPAQNDSGMLLRYFYLILAGFAGGFGILMGLLVTLMHLASLKSFGTLYLSPIAPLGMEEMKDTFIRMPVWSLQKRPKSITNNSTRRQDNTQMPSRQNIADDE